MSDIARFMDRECNTVGCQNRGVLASPAGLQTAYRSGDDMNADQRCEPCRNAIGTVMLAVWVSVRDQQGGTDPLPETTDRFRNAARRVLSADVETLRKA